MYKEQREFSLEGLRAGNKAEISRWVESNLDPIYRLSLRMLGMPQDAEDITQETFIKALNALPDFEGRSSLSTWLYRIAMNEALMVLRKKHPEMISVDEERETDEGVPDPIQIKDWCCLPENEMMNSETRMHLDRAIAKLSTSLRAVFILRDIQGLSIQETAEIMKISEANVKTRLLRARLALRETLTDYFGEKMNRMNE